MSLQAVSAAIVGVELACGGFGPMVLPFRYHCALWFKLPGTSIFGTTLLAMVLREKARALRKLPISDP